MNSKGESGSPCLRPFPWGIGSRGMPFRSTHKVEVVSRAAIQLRQLRGKPLCCMSEMR
jgi:hypothetical protein